MSHRKSNRGERGLSLIIGTASLVAIVPLLGLFIDLGILYSVKARLQAAVDGAALAAARSLTDGSSLTAQESNAEQVAKNWFYANFPPGNWSTTNTTIVTDVAQPDATVANLQDVTFTAQTTVPTWFMRFLNFTSTTIQATGTASRRDVVAMLVLDTSGSMCSVNGVNQGQPCSESNTTEACAAMITAAKNFTGQFAEGRDMIGLITFNDTPTVTSPTTSFQATFGYTNQSGSGTGSIDSIQCQGGTGTAAAISVAYNELYKKALPGALNVIMLETDGLPNTVDYNWAPGTHAQAAALFSSSSGCTDTNGKTISQSGSWTSTTARQWSSVFTMGPSGYMSDVPAGAIGAFYANDPSQGAGIQIMLSPWGSGNISYGSSGTAKGCDFSNYTNDFAALPGQDVFGNAVSPSTTQQASGPFQSITTSGGNIPLGNGTSTDWTNAHGGALNAAQSAAYNARVGTNLSGSPLQATVFVIGLGGNSGDPPNQSLLQRMANDPNTGKFNSPDPCTQTGETCYTYTSQPEGIFIYSPSTATLGEAFLTIASQVLRLSH